MLRDVLQEGTHLTYSLTHSYSLTLTYSLLLAHSLTYSLLLTLTHSLTHLLTHSYSLLLTHLLTHSLTLSYSLTHSLTHLLTHLNKECDNRPTATKLLQCAFLRDGDEDSLDDTGNTLEDSGGLNTLRNDMLMAVNKSLASLSVPFSPSSHSETDKQSPMNIATPSAPLGGGGAGGGVSRGPSTPTVTPSRNPFARNSPRKNNTPTAVPSQSPRTPTAVTSHSPAGVVQREKLLPTPR